VVLGGVIARATTKVEDARQEKARRRQEADAEQAKEYQDRQESFKIRAELLDRTARCAAQMYVTCRHVERLQANGGVSTGFAVSRQSALLAAPALLDERFLAFSAEGLTVQTEIEARFRTSNVQVDLDSQPGTEGRDVGMGESSLRWHQVYDVLTVYYYSLTGTFPADLLRDTSATPERFHSGLDLAPTVVDVSAPTPAELTDLQAMLRKQYVDTMPRLARALLNEQLIAPVRSKL
jgi:hypothetical protein